MARTHRLLRHVFPLALAAGLCAPSLYARPNGYAAECGGCHYAQLEDGGTTPAPTVNAVVASTRIEPGAQLDITVTVEATWPDARVAGFLIMADAEAGLFTPSEEGTGNVGLVAGEAFDYAIGHTAARELVAGATTFQASWTAPIAAGAYEFDVYAVTSDDGDGMDDPDVAQEANDSFGKFELTIGVGCDVAPYFYDGDLDGYGAEQRMLCEPAAGYVLQGGDCQDDNAAVNPGAVEECSFLDENCDGEPMAPPTFYRDVDGDGYGAASDILVDTCTLPEGYATEPGDCAASDPAIHPGASEVADNGVDDNCNGMIDEPAAAPIAGGGAGGGGPVEPDAVPAGAAGQDGTPDAAGGSALQTPEAPAPMDGGSASPSGCGVVPAGGHSGGLAVGWLLLGAGLLRRRPAGRS